jgi:hypothetical protein
MTSNFIEKRFRKFFIKKVIVFSAIIIMWFVFGIMMILRDSVKKEELKVISGELTDWQIIEIPGYRQMIDILTFGIKENNEKVALYLNSKEDYNPLTDKFEKGGSIKILYNDKGHIAKGGFNLHVYEIIYENEILLEFRKTTQRGMTVGLILFGVGAIFGFYLIFVIKKEFERKKSSSQHVV